MRIINLTSYIDTASNDNDDKDLNSVNSSPSKSEDVYNDDDDKYIPTPPSTYPQDILMVEDNNEDYDEQTSGTYYTPRFSTNTSLNETKNYFSDNELSYEEKLANLSTIIATEKFDLNIRRRKIYQDTMQKLKIHFKNGVRSFKVSFVGDDVTDGEGPLREFFSLFFDDAKNYILCSGVSSQFTFLHITEKMKAKEFLYFGNLIALAIINGCAGPRYFLPSLAAKLLNVADIPPLIDDVADLDVQQKLKELLVTNEESTFQKVIENFPERFTAGVTKPRVHMSEKHSFIEDICFHYCLSICSEEIDEVIKGLDLFGLRSILSNHYDHSVKEFVQQTKQTAKDLLDVFKTICYSDSTERKDKEEDIVYNLTNFIESLDVTEYNRTIISPDLDHNTEERKITLIDVIRFCSGSQYILESMKSKGTIKFIYPGEMSQGRRIEAHTCAINSRIPCN